jgi:SAM-dependent methyltransferase
MAHQAQIDFCTKIKHKLPNYFKNKKVLDVGSLDINGNNRYLFENSSYCGIDIGPGPNVDIITVAHEFNAPNESFDMIVSTSCFEHDKYYVKTFQKIVNLLRTDGMFLFTVATTGYPEHGTRKTNIQDAPLLSQYNDWADYYKNIDEADVRSAINIDDIFKEYEFEIFNTPPTYNDLYFYGIKK